MFYNQEDEENFLSDKKVGEASNSDVPRRRGGAYQEKEKVMVEEKPEPQQVEQEESAIISYDELVKNKNKVGIDYDEEYSSDIPNLSIKKINLTNEVKIEEEQKLEVKLMQYDKEEAFLKALKQLQENLSR